MRLPWLALCFAVLAAGGLTACDDSRGDPTPVAQDSPIPWSKERFLHAHPNKGTPTARTAIYGKQVGALFAHDTGGDHFCTASTINSPGHDLLITAAHCIHTGQGGSYYSDLVFVPDYRSGLSPYGIWKVRDLLVDPRWAQSSDPDMDVGFVTTEPLNKQNITDVIGANHLATNKGFQNVVRITGYPQTSDQPITCKNRTYQQSARQMRFACAGYLRGTSGSPWLTKDGEVIGVVGGYQEGGNTSEISYSPYFGDDVESLYEEAVRETG